AEHVKTVDVIVTTTARTDEEARELLKLFGFPFPIEAQEKEAA
ncbi:MAG: 50S ribosomal protein L5, partial [Sphingomonadales bacterium]|nr:50S ribosomal protein L5 [Sphingomonadales bacterium]